MILDENYRSRLVCERLKIVKLQGIYKIIMRSYKTYKLVCFPLFPIDTTP